jgi:methylglutaconyl-CoA hydratase
MADSRLLIQMEAGVARLTLNRPDVHNAFDDELIHELSAVLARMESDDNVRIVVLAANGRNFSAGADLQWMRRTASYTEEQNFEDSLRLAEMMRRLDALGKPTIARVHGSVLGGGVGLVACCDIAIAGEEAKFCFSEVRLGLIPAVISPYIVAAIGARQARRYFLTAETFSSAEALRIGLVHQVVPENELDETVDHIAQSLSHAGPTALSAAKRWIAEVSGKPINDELARATARRIAALRASPEAQDGMQAFLEKRKPLWRG